MSLKDNWTDLIDGESEVVVKPINDIANATIALEENIGNIEQSLDELHNYAQALIGGGE